MSNVLKDKNWQEWKSFPDARKKEYLFAPIGYSVYQLYDKSKKKYVLLRRGKKFSSQNNNITSLTIRKEQKNNDTKKIMFY